MITKAIYAFTPYVMDRFIPSFLALVVVIIGGIILLFYLSHGILNREDKKLAVTGLHARVHVGQHKNGIVSIEAQSLDDMLIGMGYAHGVRRTWWIALLRQTALGRLGEWFGEDVLEIDHLSHGLLFADRARDTYSNLDTKQQQLLSSFSTGINTALQSRRVELADEFVIFGITPEPWKPWHTLAIERLIVWLCVDRPDALSIERAGEDAVRFWEADVLLHQLLNVHGFSSSMSWALQLDDAVTLYQRHVYGAAAIPYYLEMVLRRPGNQLVSGASIPGTPFFIGGRNDEFAWSVLLSGQSALEWRPIASIEPHIDHQRVYETNGREHLFSYQRSDAALLFTPDQTRTDSQTGVSVIAPYEETIKEGAYEVVWSGFSSVTDFDHWISLLEGSPPMSFDLFDGNTLILDREGTFSTLGQAEDIVSTHTGVVMGSHQWSNYVATRLDSIAHRFTDNITPIVTLTNDTFSAWAASINTALISRLSLSEGMPEQIAESLTYLRNWNHTYNAESIGASIFDTWVFHFREQTGSFPSTALFETDSLQYVQSYQSLVEAVQNLTNRYGHDLSQWRWERVYPDRFYYPVWSFENLISDTYPLLSQTRYAPFILQSSGHPSTVSWGPSANPSELQAPAVWESWVSTDSWHTMHFLRHDLPSRAFMSRNLILDRPPTVQAVRVSIVVSPSTVLIPV